MSQVNLHLEPSLYVSGAHVMACDNCHGLDLKDPNGTAFIEVEWRVPYHDLDVNWSQKSAAQICARVKSNLSTWLQRYKHFHGDSRLFWATTSGILPDGTTKPTAPPHDWDEFLRRVDHWNNFGTPCP